MALQQQLEILEKRIDYLETLIASVGLPVSPWLSPSQAAPLLSISPNQIRHLIEQAELARLQNNPSDLIYGRDYKSIQSQNSSTHTWKINVLGFKRYFDIPPEKRN